jgi:hypothetical protein
VATAALLTVGGTREHKSRRYFQLRAGTDFYGGGEMAPRNRQVDFDFLPSPYRVRSSPVVRLAAPDQRTRVTVASARFESNYLEQKVAH